MNKLGWIDGVFFILLLMGYALIYRTYTDGKRLADKNILLKKDIWKVIIPGKRLQHFRALYLP